MLCSRIQHQIINSDVHRMIRERGFYFIGVPFELVRALNVFMHRLLRWSDWSVLGGQAFFFDGEADDVFRYFYSH